METGRVERGGADKPSHTVTNADNYHALEMLTYTHRHAIDTIYIDPLYNTGAKDWKYNNYVEGTTTIDTASGWPSWSAGWSSPRSSIDAAGATRQGTFARAVEYRYFRFGSSRPGALVLGEEWNAVKTKNKADGHWGRLIRGGVGESVPQRPNRRWAHSYRWVAR